jgi:hypothetical protein
MSDREKLHYEGLKQFCETVRQTEVLEAIIEHGSCRAAADAIGCHHSVISRTAKRIERYAAQRGFAPGHDLTQVLPDSQYLKGASTLYKVDGEKKQPVLQWVKSQAKIDDGMQCLREFAEGLAENLAGKAEPVAMPKEECESNLLTVYPIADVHLGMLSWGRETGADWDLEIASRAVRTAVDRVIEDSCASETAVVANLGDFFHFDDDERRTKRGNNALDGDGRWAKVIRLGVQLLKHTIDTALKKHQRVHVVNSVGNHDDQTGGILPLMLEPFYASEPRVTVDTSPAPHHYYRFGANLLGFYHGHETKLAALLDVMMSDRILNSRHNTVGVEHCMWFTGHVHHEARKEYSTGVVESFRTIAAPDMYAASHGYRALRDLQSVTFHVEYGELCRARTPWKLVKYLLET